MMIEPTEAELNGECPDCKLQATQILYGMPSPQAFNDPDVWIGGCLIEPFAPKWHCKNCGIQF